MIIKSQVPELDIPQKMEIISEQPSAAKQVSEQFKHGEQEIKEGVGRHCTSQSLTPLPGEGMWESSRDWAWHRSGTLVCHSQGSYT